LGTRDAEDGPALTFISDDTPDEHVDERVGRFCHVVLRTPATRRNGCFGDLDHGG